MTAMETAAEPMTDTEPDRSRAIATGRRVMAIEAQALALFADQLGEAFADAVALMLSARGRIIVSGMEIGRAHV